MKIIHCADLHLGSAFSSHLPREKAEERRAELRSSFVRLVAYAEKAGVRAIVLAGDVFDCDRPLMRDKQFFYSVVGNNPTIDFIYLRGNHDGKESYTESELPNLKCFTGEWGCYSYGDVDIYGTELPYVGADDMYLSLKCRREKYNIVVMHGQTGTDINLAALRDKNIDYLALGHIHSYSESRLDSRGVVVYSGCLEGRGFDETGEKGFVLIDTAAGVHEFIPFAQRRVTAVSVDVSGSGNALEAFLRVKETVKVESRNIYLITLSGKVSFRDERLATDVGEYLAPLCYFACVKDGTVKAVDVNKLASELSLRGEFVRAVLADQNTDDERKELIISVGLDALDGREVEL